MKKVKKNKAFTLIELLLVVAIIGLLTSIAWPALNNMRAKARDTRRFEDLQTIRKAIEMYVNDNGHFPKESANANGKIGEGAGIDSMIEPYIKGSVPSDPLGPGNNTYYYYYDGNQSCDGVNKAIIFARNLEVQSGASSRSACSSWGGEGGAGQSNSYIIILGNSDG